MSEPKETRRQAGQAEPADVQPTIARREVTNRILKAFHLRADKSLGQNFLVEESVVARIAAAAELTPADKVLEIGPGIGTLTQALARTGAQVTSVELDQRLLPVLAETVGCYANVRIVHGDILKTDIPALLGGDSFKVAANLPYYITTPIIMHLLEQGLPLERLVVMVQKEVAERMTAAPGSRAYGAISVAMQYYTEPRLAFVVKAGSFLPAPKVDSAVLVCRRHTAPPVAVPDEKVFFRVVAAAFSVRRKMLTNSLRHMGGLSGDQVKAWLAAAGIDGTRRAETLSLEEFAALARAFGPIGAAREP